MNENVNQSYLESKGFKRDTTAPEGVNRWEREDGHRDELYIVGRTYYVTVTLTPGGEQTRYGRINFLGDYGHMHEFRRFEKAISVPDFERFLDPKCTQMPEGVELRLCPPNKI